MLCPRCRCEVADAHDSCPGCGTPLRLGDEPSPRTLDVSIPIDRRGEEPAADDATVPAGVTAPIDVPRRRSELEDAERSFFESGAFGGPDAGPPAGSATGSAGRTKKLAVGRDGDGFLQPDHDLPRTAPREIRAVRPETWRRAAAWAVDAVPFAVGAVMLARHFVRQAALPAPVQGLDGFLDLVAQEWVIVVSVTVAATLALAVYATLAHALAGATLGKKLFGLRVVCADGARPTMGRSVARTALGVASAGLLGLGFLLALFTRSGRALHDFLARTWVVRVP